MAVVVETTVTAEATNETDPKVEAMAVEMMAEEQQKKSTKPTW